MGELIQLLLPTKLLALLLKPFVRLIISLVAVPLCRLFLHKVVRRKDLDAELERDISLWLRGSLLLLIAAANMEGVFFKWVPHNWNDAWVTALRLMLAIGVIEGMPDQALFAIIHGGPVKLRFEWRRPWSSLKVFFPRFFFSQLCRYFNRASPVLAILTVFFQGPIGWVCYGLAVTNYLIIGLVSSRDRAIDVLRQFDRAIAKQREELIEELAPHEPLPPLAPRHQILAAEQGGPFAADVQSKTAD